MYMHVYMYMYIISTWNSSFDSVSRARRNRQHEPRTLACLMPELHRMSKQRRQTNKDAKSDQVILPRFLAPRFRELTEDAKNDQVLLSKFMVLGFRV